MTALIVEDCELMRRLIDGVADAIVECESGDAAYAAHQIRATFPDARILIVSDYGDERLVAPCQTPNG